MPRNKTSGPRTSRRSLRRKPLGTSGSRSFRKASRRIRVSNGFLIGLMTLGCFLLPVVLSPVSAAELLLPARAAVSGAEQQAERLVQRALLARLSGNEEGCRRLLDEALELRPDYPRARWLSGHVHEQDRWVAVEEHQGLAAISPLLDEYETQRKRVGRDSKREWTLAKWCDRVGLMAQRNFHYGRLLASGQLAERQAKEVVKALDLELAGGQFWSKEELSQLQDQAASTMASLRKWLPYLTQIEQDLHSGDAAKIAIAERRLLALEAAGAEEILPALEAIMPVASERLGLEGVKILARTRAFESTLLLTRYAILSPAESVRQAATEELGRRPLHEFVPFLLASLNAPIRSQFTIQARKDGIIQYQHHFLRHGREANSVVQASHMSAPREIVVPSNEGLGDFDVESTSAEAISVWALAAVREMQLARDNALILQQNSRIFPILHAVTRQQLPNDPSAWWQWWQQYNETPQQRPTFVQRFRNLSMYSSNTTVHQRTGSCFAAGTPVWTERGLRPIETIQPGDRVLSQNPDTGELCYKVVIAPTAAAPGSGMTQMGFGDNVIHITHAHVVWVNGKGWEIVRRVTPGDQLASLSGSATITRMTDRPVTPLVHNLVVEDFHTFFVGRDGILVHDITYMTFRQPSQAVVPGLLASHVPGRE